MARAETIENVGETGGGGNSPLPRPGTCHMELPGPFNTWSQVHPLQAFYLSSYQLHAPPPHPEGQDEPLTHQHVSAPSSAPPPPPSSPPCNRGTFQPSAFLGERSDLDRVELMEASRRQGPLPDLLPQNEHSSWASQHHRASMGEPELEVRRLASQLRTIGDEFNTTVLRRVHADPHRQDWRDIWRGLLNFINQTLSTLYRLT
ncbi:bcl-2-binding component 3 [Scomber scombrus]|uniref:Bcl-2-binding component 3 n=1 Tax=Scomber scombrus TaxID=13677 RepID=A0AAV1NHC2_SCOSC